MPWHAYISEPYTEVATLLMVRTERCLDKSSIINSSGLASISNISHSVVSTEHHSKENSKIPFTRKIVTFTTIVSDCYQELITKEGRENIQLSQNPA